MDWLNFALALAAFFASHWIPARPGVKRAMQARLGPRLYAAVFGLVSLAVLAWVIVAAGRAPYVTIWEQYPWMRWAANIIMPLAVALVVLALGAPNPLSFGGRREGFDPLRPGLAGIMRHPLLWALFLWSAAHLLVNGDLAHVILFGIFALFCLAGMGLLDKRRRRDLGAAEWQRLAAVSPNLPFARGLRRWHPPVWRLVLALALWAGLILAHPWVIGVSPLP